MVEKNEIIQILQSYLESNYPEVFLDNQDILGTHKTAQRFIELIDTLANQSTDFSEISSGITKFQGQITELQKIEVLGLCPHHLTPFKGQVSLKHASSHFIGFASYVKLVKCFFNKIVFIEKALDDFRNYLENELKWKREDFKITATTEQFCCYFTTKENPIITISVGDLEE